MRKLIIIDDENCSSDLEDFILKNSEHIQLVIDDGELKLQLDKVLDDMKIFQQNQHRILLDAENSLLRYQLSEIVYVDKQEENSVFHYKRKNQLKINSSIDEVEKKLVAEGFFRINDNVLINVHCLELLKPQKNQLIMEDYTTFRIDRRKLKPLIKLINKYNIN